MTLSAMTPLSLFALVLASSVLAQDSSSSDQLFTIQTSFPAPESSGSSTRTTSLSGSPTSASSGAFAPTATPESQLPAQCTDACSVISDALSVSKPRPGEYRMNAVPRSCQTCAGESNLNTTCLCTTEVEQSYVECIQCALDLNPDPSALASYQALIDGYITQCATAEPPVTLPNATITLPGSTSGAGNATSSGSSSNNGSAMSTSSSRSSSTAVLPSSSVSSTPAPSSSAASPSASASQSGGAGRVRSEMGWYGGVAVAGLVGVVGGMMVLA